LSTLAQLCGHANMYCASLYHLTSIVLQHSVLSYWSYDMVWRGMFIVCWKAGGANLLCGTTNRKNKQKN